VKLLCQSGGESERDGLASDLTHAISLNDANTARVTVQPGLPNPVQPVGWRGGHGPTHSPDYGNWGHN
jgi:hypothetical protein